MTAEHHLYHLLMAHLGHVVSFIRMDGFATFECHSCRTGEIAVGPKMAVSDSLREMAGVCERGNA
jgi:hypothetical protein